MYEFNGLTVDDDMIEAIRRYVDHGIEPGGFLTAVICNDLKGACGSADYRNLPNLPAFVAYFYNETPSACWGSDARFLAWMKRKADDRG